jgi:hypothetical protein
MEYEVKRELYYWNKPGERKYQILEDTNGTYFAVHNVHNIELAAEVLLYSQQQNDIVKILEQGKWIVTEYLENYQPVIIRSSCDYYKDLGVSQYNKFFKQHSNCQQYYNRIANSHIDFMKSTGWCFTDRTGTNVMVNNNYTDFKIIDVMSLAPVKESQALPVAPFFVPNRWEKALAHKQGMIMPNLINIQELVYNIHD